MQDLKSLVNQQQYSTVNNNLNYSTVKPLEVLSNIPDVIHQGYEPFYVKQLEKLGYERFMELVSRARAGSDTPQKLFSWMLKNHEQVR